ncbi:probable calcium-binding protein CML35 [Dioscorea cayenensis subsp. rotundata]|uniref:Probable calcium-binding protein CML35 n=1 Tax=Dioscorea cayennensis subsp. rotundata TaxID=55577 RepID=A0AB40C830_DIOCR|nr:probable calcium-binding protein CML35 [Dioscorea cayenensis subsp. rotundata]
MKINFPTFFTSKDSKLSKKSKKKPNSSSSFSSSSSDDSISSSITRSPKTVLPPSPSSDLFDVDKITARDLETVIRRLGHSPISDEDLSLILAEIVADDGCIPLESLTPKPSGPADLHDAFSVFDADGDGRISAEELLGVFVAIGDDGCTIEQCRRMIGAVDSDGDGFVCFQDFVRLMDGQRSC